MFSVTLFLVCFLHNFGFLQCRRTATRLSEDLNKAGLIGRCLRSCGSLAEEREREISKLRTIETSSRETCFKKCLGKKDEDKLEFRGKTGSRTSDLRLVTPLLRRRKRSTDLGDETSPCPNDVNDDSNIYPTIRKVERNQYEDSNMSYVNISWYPMDEGLTNFTSYVFVYWYMDMDGNDSRPVRFIERPKNETYMVYPESKSGWRYDMYFSFNVIALPCLSGYYTMKDLKEYLSPSPSQATVSPSNKTTMKLTAFVTIFYHWKLGFKYDAFIIFNFEDQEWVNGTLLRILEKEQGFKCCVHYRDFKPGGVYIDTMCDSVLISRKTVAVVSENFFKSEYCEFELEKAIERLVEKCDDSIIVIRKDKVSSEKLPEALKKRSFIDYSDLTERKSWVSKLIKALESNRDEENLGINDEDNCPSPSV
ncbi:Toll-like receptor [Desmophyllum pertusum]|uniref:Toll-like receptor n=1 Tax=Desmophyllum pertusum TaxID=174260 RepID=A0A9W9YF40_9CNID|nr:Toll-like receptor [Desmophyllum pertusum]